MYSFRWCFSGSPDLTTGKKKNPPEIPAGFRKTDDQLSRSEIPPGHNEMPRNALQRGGGGVHRLDWVCEHFAVMLG